MPRRLVAINIVLAAVSVLCVALIVKQLVDVRPAAAPRQRPPVAAPAEPAPAGDSRLSPQAYNVIASRNLFSPTRSETSGPAQPGTAPATVAKPSLHGVVLREGSPIAYLEDPLTKRIAGYRIGDPIAGGTVQTISADAVVISRPDGMVDVRLRDPSKPRPAPPQPAAQPGVPGQPPFPGQPPAGGQLPNQGLQPMPGPAQPPPRAFTPSGTPIPGQPIPPPPAIQAPGGPSTPLPFSRPSPSLGRRLPPVPQDPSGQPLPAPSQ
jgi:type II secretion system (T2SS) protein C